MVMYKQESPLFSIKKSKEAINYFAFIHFSLKSIKKNPLFCLRMSIKSLPLARKSM